MWRLCAQCLVASLLSLIFRMCTGWLSRALTLATSSAINTALILWSAAYARLALWTNSSLPTATSPSPRCSTISRMCQSSFMDWLMCHHYIKNRLLWRTTISTSCSWLLPKIFVWLSSWLSIAWGWCAESITTPTRSLYATYLPRHVTCMHHWLTAWVFTPSSRSWKTFHWNISTERYTPKSLKSWTRRSVSAMPTSPTLSSLSAKDSKNRGWNTKSRAAPSQSTAFGTRCARRM